MTKCNVLLYLAKNITLKIWKVCFILDYCTVGESPWKRKKECVFLLQVRSFQELCVPHMEIQWSVGACGEPGQGGLQGIGLK